MPSQTASGRLGPQLLEDSKDRSTIRRRSAPPPPQRVEESKKQPRKKFRVYCAGPMRAGGKFVDNFHDMIKIIEELGHDSLSELSSIVKWGETGGKLTWGAGGSTEPGPAPDMKGDQYIYARDIFWLERADVLIAEVSGPSLGVGYEICYALHNCHLPVLCLLNKSVEAYSAMLSGNTSPRLDTVKYSTREDMKRAIVAFMDRLV